MKALAKVDRNSRAAVKRASRRPDTARLEKGEHPKKLQRENSMLPENFFKDARISNLKNAVGR